jgi:hypothetical protein
MKLKIPTRLSMSLSQFFLWSSLISVATMFMWTMLMQNVIYDPMRSEIDTLQLFKNLNVKVNYHQMLQIDSLKTRVDDLENPDWLDVVGTTYNPVKEQCDSTPDILADNTKINIWHASVYKYIAVSQNMLVKNGGHLEFGDYVYVDAIKKSKSGRIIGNHTGVYQVKDVMNKRYTNRIDFLQTPGDKDIVYWDAKMLKIEVKV